MTNKLEQMNDEEREAVLMAHMSDEERTEEHEFLNSVIEKDENGAPIHPFTVELGTELPQKQTEPTRSKP